MTRPLLSRIWRLTLLGEERQLGRVKPALAVRRHVTAAARELSGKHRPKPKPKHRLRKVLGAALVAAVVIVALRKEHAERVILLLGIYLAAFVLDSPASIIVLVAACVLEPFEIAFLRNWSKRIGRRTKATTGAEGMIGKRAEVVRECRPTGTVRVGSELWEARCEGGAAPGDEVRVDASRS